MNKDEMKMIKDIMAVIVRHHSGLGCDVLCDGDQCENCYLTAKDLYYEGYRKVADDEIVVKMTDIMDLNNKAQGTTDFLRDKLAEISKQIDEATKIADDEIVIKKNEYEALKKDKNDYKQRFETSDKRCEQLVQTSVETLEKKHQYWENKCKEIRDIASKETAREVTNKIYNKLTESDVWHDMKKIWWRHNNECYELKEVLKQVLKELGIELED